jgi:cell division septation protein DedD
MTDQAYSAKWSTEPPQLGMQTLWRLAIWGGVATLALVVAVISAFFSGAGSNRQTASAAAGQTSTAQVSSAQETATQGTAAQGAEQPRTFAGEPARRAGDAAEETRRLAETIRALAADRDQALSRIAALERNLDGLTGTIKRDTGTTKRDSIQRDLAPTLSPPPSQSPPQSPSAATSSAPPAPPETPAAPVTEATVTPAPTPASQQSGVGDAAPMAAAAADAPPAPAANPVHLSTPAEQALASAGLGIDVGGAGNYQGLRTLWHSTRNIDPALLEGFYPLAAVRENGKTHGADLRLVIGPIADAETATRLCTTLAASHHYCQPVAFEGQRLSMTDAGSTKAPPAQPRTRLEERCVG